VTEHVVTTKKGKRGDAKNKPPRGGGNGCCPYVHKVEGQTRELTKKKRRQVKKGPGVLGVENCAAKYPD